MSILLIENVKSNKLFIRCCHFKLFNESMNLCVLSKTKGILSKKLIPPRTKKICTRA